jgi:dipeptidyl aminopeptidase/acylaminoacyl peptidase
MMPQKVSPFAARAPYNPVMEQAIDFISHGLALKGFLHMAEGAGKHPGLVLCHGFGGSCRGAGHPELAKALEQAGYAVLRFDFRGCGQSEGRRGEVIVDEEIADLSHAIDFLEAQPHVDAARIGVIGASLGGSVAIEIAARDPRVKVCVANGSVGNGERRYRAQYKDEVSWQAFLQRLEQAKHAGTTLNRFEIVYIPESDRAGLPPGAIMDFTAATAQSLLDSCPEHVVAQIAPRPLLLIHPRGDRVVPYQESEALAKAAGKNAELHIIEGSAHFGSGSTEIARLVLDFLKRHLPAKAP